MRGYHASHGPSHRWSCLAELNLSRALRACGESEELVDVSGALLERPPEHGITLLVATGVEHLRGLLALDRADDAVTVAEDVTARLGPHANAVPANLRAWWHQLHGEALLRSGAPPGPSPTRLLPDRTRVKENPPMASTLHYTLEELLGPLNEVEKKHAPEELFVAGDVSLLRAGRRVSVVGSRGASKEGLARAARLARMLVEHGVVVVSGLAEGVDTVAHTEAIEVGGRTIAVLGTPLDTAYPAKNRGLQERIAREHLAVSQFTPGSAGGRHCFPMRNRTMALLSDATVIVEAGEGSGTIHQGWEALRLGRPLFLLESIVKAEGIEWPGELLAYGAEVLSEKTVELFFEMLPESSRVERTELAL